MTDSLVNWSYWMKDIIFRAPGFGERRSSRLSLWFTKPTETWGSSASKMKLIECIHDFTQRACFERAKSEVSLDCDLFISLYCNPDVVCEIQSGMYSLLLYAYPDNPVSRDFIMWSLRKMPYVDFLKTVYWRSISEYVKIKARYRCSICNSNELALHVHHRTYDCRGIEIFQLEDLICLCSECHELFHISNQ